MHERLTCVHWSRCDIVNTDPARLEFLAHSPVALLAEDGEGESDDIPSKVFDRSFATSVRSIVASKRAEERSNNADDLSAIGNMSSGFLENEERSLGVHPKRCLLSQ